MAQDPKLVNLINTIWDSVEASKAGPIFGVENGQKVINQVGATTFFGVLNASVPHVIQYENKDPKEPWQT